MTPTLSEALEGGKGPVISAIGPFDRMMAVATTMSMTTVIGNGLPSVREWCIMVMRPQDAGPLVYRGFASRSAAQSAFDAAVPATSSVNVVKHAASGMD